MTKPLARHFLQSPQWAQFQRSLGKEVIERSGKGWSYLAIKETGDGKLGKQFSRLYCPYGPYFESATALAAALADLDSVARAEKVDYVRVEPTNMAKATSVAMPNNFHKLPKSFQPNLTLLITIDIPFEEVLHGMSKTNRYLWNKVEKNNLTFDVSYDSASLKDFISMIEQTEARTGTKLHDAAYFRKLVDELGPEQYAGVAYVRIEGEPLSGVLFVDDIAAKTRYYLYAGSYDKARQYSANSPLVTFLLKQGQECGLQRFDFFGISEKSKSNHRWAGFSQFKRSFGGDEWSFMGTFEKPIRPLRYKIMHTARKALAR